MSKYSAVFFSLNTIDLMKNEILNVLRELFFKSEENKEKNIRFENNDGIHNIDNVEDLLHFEQINCISSLIKQDFFIECRSVNDRIFHFCILFEDSNNLLKSEDEISDFCKMIFLKLSCYYGIIGQVADKDESEPNQYRIDLDAMDLPETYIFSVKTITWGNYFNEFHIKNIFGMDEIKTDPDFLVEELGNNGISVRIKDGFSISEVNIDKYRKLSRNCYNLKILRNDTRQQSQKKTTENQLILDQLAIFQEYVYIFNEEYLKINKVPRNNVWRPLRFCSQDHVMGLTVVRHSIKRNILEVDVCLISEIPLYEEGTSARMMLTFLITEAYKCGGSLEIAFTRHMKDKSTTTTTTSSSSSSYNTEAGTETTGTIPEGLQQLARQFNIKLSKKAEGIITKEESQALFVKLLEFPEPLLERMQSLSDDGCLSIPKVCYSIHKGLWSMHEVETILYGTDFPENIFHGDMDVEFRHLYRHDLMHARTAILGGILDCKLSRRKHELNETMLDDEDDVIPLTIQFDPDTYSKIYSCQEDIEIPWIQGDRQTSVLEKGKILRVMLRPRNLGEMSRFLKEDLNQAILISKNRPDEMVAVLLTREYDEIPEKLDLDLKKMENIRNIVILVCPETSYALESEAEKRFASSRIMRE